MTKWSKSDIVRKKNSDTIPTSEPVVRHVRRNKTVKAKPKRTVRGRRPRTPERMVVDEHVGRQIRERRTMLGMSQEKLGELIGLTFQQVQKYERGMNRVGASMLWDIANILDVPVSYFFDGLSSADPPPPVYTRSVMECAKDYIKLGPDAQGVVRQLCAYLANAANAAYGVPAEA